MSVVPGVIENPPYKLVTAQQMQKIMCDKKPECQIAPSHFDGKNLYVIKNIPWWNSKELSSTVIHNIVHYVQFIKANKDFKNLIDNFAAYEEEAQHLQSIYLNQETI